MKLYVCWGTFATPGGHPCRDAQQALRKAGYEPRVVRSYSAGFLPPLTSGRREVKRLTGDSWVPTLVLDDGTVVDGSQAIVGWAEAHPAAA